MSYLLGIKEVKYEFVESYTNSTPGSTLSFGSCQFGDYYYNPSTLKDLLYVPDFTDNDIKIIDLANPLTVMTTVSSISTPVSVVVDTSKNVYYVASRNPTSNRILVYDLTNNLLVTTMIIDGFATAESAHNCVFDRVGNRLFMATRGTNKIYIRNRTDYSAITSVDLGVTVFPTYLAYDENNKYLYVACTGATAVRMYLVNDDNTFTFIKTITTGYTDYLCVKFDNQEGNLTIGNSLQSVGTIDFRLTILDSITTARIDEFIILPNNSSLGGSFGLYPAVNGFLYAICSTQIASTNGIFKFKKVLF